MRALVALALLACCATPAERPAPADAGPSAYVRCLDLCQQLEGDGLLCGDPPRYPVSECASLCAEVIP